MDRGPLFVKNFGVPTLFPNIEVPPTHSLSLEMSEEAKIMRVLKEKKEMDEILASLKVPRTEVSTLEKALTQKSEDLVSKMIIILLPRDRTKPAL